MHVLTGHGKDEEERDGAVALADDTFQCLTADSIEDARDVLPIY